MEDFKKPRYPGPKRGDRIVNKGGNFIKIATKDDEASIRVGWALTGRCFRHDNIPDDVTVLETPLIDEIDNSENNDSPVDDGC